MSVIDDFRNQFCDLISVYSEERWAAGWMSGIEKDVRAEGGKWILQAYLCGGWPIGYRGEDGWEPLTENELKIAKDMYEEIKPNYA